MLLLTNLSKEQTAGLRIEERVDEYKEIKRVVFQGCTLSTDFSTLRAEIFKGD